MPTPRYIEQKVTALRYKLLDRELSAFTDGDTALAELLADIRTEVEDILVMPEHLKGRGRKVQTPE